MEDFNINIHDLYFHSRYDRCMEFDKYDQQIPYINFPSHWLVAMRPSFGGAIVRFKVKLPEHKKGFVSVFLDGHDIQGRYNKQGHPYWEVHPCFDDVGRCHMQDTESLLKMIEEGLRQISEEEYGERE